MNEHHDLDRQLGIAVSAIQRARRAATYRRPSAIPMDVRNAIQTAREALAEAAKILDAAERDATRKGSDHG